MRELLLKNPSMKRTTSWGGTGSCSMGMLNSPVGDISFRSSPQERDGEAKVLELEKVGAALSHLDVLCRIGSIMRLEEVDWRTFRRDILDLASPELSVVQKLQIIQMIRNTYSVIFHN